MRHVPDLEFTLVCVLPLLREVQPALQARCEIDAKARGRYWRPCTATIAVEAWLFGGPAWTVGSVSILYIYCTHT